MTVFLTLRSGPSGAPFQGSANNDTLLWSVTEGKFYVGAIPPPTGLDSDDIANVSGVSGASVSDALDTLQTEINAITQGLTAVWFVDLGAAPGGDGTIALPFKTFAAAIAAAQADFNLNNRNQQIMVTAGDYQAEAPQTITFDGNNALSISGWTSNLSTPSQPLLPVLTVVQGDLLADGVAWIGVANPQVDVSGWDFICTGTHCNFYTCENLQAVNSNLGSGQVGNLAQFDNCVVGALQCTTARIHNCPGLAPTLITGDVQIDAFSNNGSVTATGTLFVIGRAAKETISVVVPAVAAGNVGYVDAIMTGQLALLPTGAPVIANPTEDLVAAGAGGGYINCRCNSPGVVRLAFIGPLAGGASDFTFCSPAAQ